MLRQYSEVPYSLHFSGRKHLVWSLLYYKCYSNQFEALRAILHDPDMYPEPEEFRPGRFLKDGKLDPDIRDIVAIFGYGRRCLHCNIMCVIVSSNGLNRICPGQAMGTRLVFAIIS